MTGLIQLWEYKLGISGYMIIWPLIVLSFSAGWIEMHKSEMVHKQGKNKKIE